MSRLLSDLDPVFRPLAVELLARACERGIPPFIVDTRRTEEEHAENLRNGTSWIPRSKHIDGLAIDICPYETYMAHGSKKLLWDASAPEWQVLGRIGKGLGLVWGGDWKGKETDMGHFEWPM